MIGLESEDEHIDCNNISKITNVLKRTDTSPAGSRRTVFHTWHGTIKSSYFRVHTEVSKFRVHAKVTMFISD